MSKGNVLEEGVWELEKLRDQLITLEQYKAKLSSSDIIEQKMEQDLHAKEVQINEEINIVVSRREREVAATYDEQIERQKSKIKKVSEKKEKNKNQKVKERIASETAMLREDNKKLSDEISQIFRQGKVSRIFNNRFCFAVLSPKGISDFMIDLLVVLLSFVIIPKFLYFMMGPKNQVLFYVVLYLVILLIVGASYYIIYYGTKLKNPEVIEKTKGLRYQMRVNQREINKIKRKITKDKDESIYNLAGYDKEIRKIEDKIQDITKEKNEALATLHNTTSNILANEIRAKYQMEVSDLHETYKKQQEVTREIEKQIQESTSVIANSYQAYLGKEFMNVAAVERLIEIMNHSDFRVVSEAVQVYREEEQQRMQMLENNKQ